MENTEIPINNEEIKPRKLGFEMIFAGCDDPHFTEEELAKQSKKSADNLNENSKK